MDWFTGEWEHKVDAKGRVSVPAEFRRVLEENDPSRKPGQPVRAMIVFGRPGRACLEGYAKGEIDALYGLLKRLPQFSPEKRSLAKMLAAKTVPLGLDDNGRLLLSQALRDKAGITDRAIFVGMADLFEIWEPSAYAADNAQSAEFVENASEQGDIYALLQAAQEKYGL